MTRVTQKLLRQNSSDADIFTDDRIKNCDFDCALQDILDAIDQQVLRKSCVKLEENEDENRHRKEDFCNDNQEFYYCANESNKEYRKSHNSYAKGDESRRKFYRVSSQDDSFESTSAEIREDLNRSVSGHDYHSNSYSEKCYRYVYLCVRKKEICVEKIDAMAMPFSEMKKYQFCDEDENDDESNDASCHDQDYSSCSYSSNCCLTDEESSEEELHTSIENNRDTLTFRYSTTNRSSTNHRQVEKAIRKIDKNTYCKSYVSSELHEIRSNKKILQIENSEYARNDDNCLDTCYTSTTLTTIEETLRVSKSSRSVMMEIRSHVPTMPTTTSIINGAGVSGKTDDNDDDGKGDDGWVFGESADDGSPDVFLRNVDNANVVRACESLHLVIDVCVREAMRRCRCWSGVEI